MTLALLFSPQGSQQVGMGHELAAAWPEAAAVYAAADAALGWGVSSVSWQGPEDRLNDTRQTQPCLVTTSLACLAALTAATDRARVPLSPSVVAGHSVGEYAALVAAGALSVTDGIRLVARRAELMADADVQGGMVAVMGLGREEIARITRQVGAPDDVVVANDNAPGQVVISGRREALAAAEPLLRAAGARRTIPLRVSGPFHSPMMQPVGTGLAAAFESVAWHDPQPPLISNVTAEPVARADELRNLLARQVSSPVEWVAVIRRAVADGVDTFVECGPGTALTGMVRRIAPETATFNVSDAATLASTVDSLAERSRARLTPASA